jgi:release factor glutamine methyltransferase
MLTVLEAIALSTKYLAEKGIDSARVNAEIMLAEILKCKRLDLYLKFDQPLKEEETQKYRNFISRRSKFEPLQYIVGHVEFYGLDFNVNPAVLIPRQETEILVQTIIENHNSQSDLKILDIGTGSGIIPVCLGKYLNNGQIVATDIFAEVFETARQNAELNEVAAQIQFVENDIFKDDYSVLGKFDIVVSNPPYVSQTEYETLQPEIRDFEPAGAVSDTEDGYKFYKRLCSIAKGLLNPDGYLYFEIGKGQEKTVKVLFETNGFTEIVIVKDYLDIERVIYGKIE